ncbi:MAG: extracellular solute-binding protein, partial [Alteromonas sp.]|nr:extracellular solute-binding protein [Alteromonas sp.]
MQRRTFLQGLAAAGVLGSVPFSLAHAVSAAGSVSVETLPKLEGDLTLYLGRGEGGLYENVLDAIKKRNPKLNLKVRRGGSAALANTIVAETKAGVKRADLFWAVDTGSIGMVTDSGAAKPLPSTVTSQLKDGFQYPSGSPVTGRVRTLPYNTERVKPEEIPDGIMALAGSDLKIGWAP